MSDLHLLPSFVPTKYEFLQKLISQCEQLIINGDLWSYYHNSFDDFFNSEWNKLFPLMLSKNAIYIYGNHDEARWSDSRVNQFSKIQTDQYKIQTESNTFYIVHGHRILYGNAGPNILALNIKKAVHFEKLRYFIEARLIGTTSTSPFLTILNKKLKKYAIEHLKQGEILVTGHTHHPEVDLENRFINEGFVNFGLAHYLEINEDSFELKFAKY